MPDPDIQKLIDDAKQDFQDKFDGLESRFIDHIHNKIDTNPVDYNDLENAPTGFSKITSASYLLSNSAAETTILSATVPGGTLSTDKGIYGRFAINMRCAASDARTFQFKVNYGSGNKSISEELPVSANVKGYLEIYVIPQASESSQKLLIGFMAQEEGASSTLLFASAANYDSEVTADSIDSTVDQTLSVTCELFAAQSGHLVRVEGGFFKLI